MSIYDDRWFELWYAEGEAVIPTHIFIISFDVKSDEIIVIDPFKGNNVVFRNKEYDAVCSWLASDEYELVEGRVFPDDGWS